MARPPPAVIPPRTARSSTSITRRRARVAASAALKPCRAAADDQHVTVLVPLLVSIGVRNRGRDAEAGRAADQRLEPTPARPQKRLVVEPRRHKPARKLCNAQRCRSRALGQQLTLRALIPSKSSICVALSSGRASRLRRAELSHSAPRTSTDKPPRAMELEASPHDSHTGSKKRRREGVTSESRIAVSIELKDSGSADRCGPRSRSRQAGPHGRISGVASEISPSRRSHA